MGIKANGQDKIDAIFKALLTEVDAQVLETMVHVGEEAVKLARLPHANNWQDQTGNLRSSIGYVVFKDGKMVQRSAFETVPPQHLQKGDKLNGAKTGLSLALEVGSTYKDGYALVVVAGMNYAAYVESKGRDVLTTAEKTSEKQIAKEMADLVTNIENAFK